MAFVGAKQEKRTQLNFLSGAMDDFRDNFDTFVEGLTPEQVEDLELTRDITQSMFEDIVETVNNFTTSRRAVRNQDG